MKLACAASIGILFCGASLVAQNANQSSSGTIDFGSKAMQSIDPLTTRTVVADPGRVNRCPVSMRAEHQSDGNVVMVGSTHPNGIGQWLHLTLAGRDSMQIRSARLTVRGMTAEGHMTETRGSGAATTAHTFNVPLSADANHTASADLWVPGMTAVERIDLEAVAYSDGTTWRPTDNMSCHVAPDPLMLITSR